METTFFLLCPSSYHGMAKKEKKNMGFVGASGGVWSVDGKLLYSGTLNSPL